jgi:pimeloyl-ACP methyl ester carboxylesterase
LLAAGAVRADDFDLPNGVIRVGSQLLWWCNQAPDAFCGSLERPLDSAGKTPGKIAIAYEWYGHRDFEKPARGTIIAVSGGPGYSTTADREHYRELFDDLLDEWNLLLADNRGTGGSAAINCAGLHSEEGWTADNIIACGWQLGDASDLYGTIPAADDLAALVAALELPSIDLYGASYGGYFAQVFAARHGDLLRSLVMDGPLSVLSEAPENAAMMRAVRRALDATCRRSPDCLNQTGEPAVRLAALIERVRKEPIVGSLPYPVGGETIEVEVNPESLLHLVQTNYMGPVALRELDAAVRASLDQLDDEPILRLVVESYAVLDPTISSPEQFSEGLFLATRCTDYRLPFSSAGRPSERRAALAAVLTDLAADQPEIYSPFLIDDLWGSDPNDRYHYCLYWPPSSAAHPQGPPLAPDTRYPEVPTLILSAEFDTVAPAEEAADIAERFPRGRHVVFANSLHIVAVDDRINCAGPMIRRFIAELDPGEMSCARDIPPIRMLPSFATSLLDVIPATSISDDGGDEWERRLAAAAVYTVADVVYRWYTDWDDEGRGLRGGAWRLEEFEGGWSYALDKVKWAAGVEVSGTVRRHENGAVDASVRVDGPRDMAGDLKLNWDRKRSQERARIVGMIGGRRFDLTMPAP